MSLLGLPSELLYMISDEVKHAATLNPFAQEQILLRHKLPCC
jgi:hypothetical protein